MLIAPYSTSPHSTSFICESVSQAVQIFLTLIIFKMCYAGIDAASANRWGGKHTVTELIFGDFLKRIGARLEQKCLARLIRCINQITHHDR